MYNERRAYIVVLAIMGFYLTAFGTGSAATIVVDDDEGAWADYTRIEQAIDNSTDGDIVRVYNGTYEEWINVDESIILSGNGSNETELVGSFRVKVDRVEISGFSVGPKYAGSMEGSINISASDCNATNNVCYNNWYGITVNGEYGGAENVSINGNVCYGNIVGIGLTSALNVSIVDNILRNN